VYFSSKIAPGGNIFYKRPKKTHSVGACVADTNARGQLMLIFGTMHNFEEYAIVIQKNDGAIFKNQL